MGEVVTFPRFPLRPIERAPVMVQTDPELATERGRLDGRPCRHADGRLGIVAGVFRHDGVVLAKFWRGMHFDPVRASRLTPTGGRPA